jgi:hypothetical protein
MHVRHDHIRPTCRVLTIAVTDDEHAAALDTIQSALGLPAAVVVSHSARQARAIDRPPFYL